MWDDNAWDDWVEDQVDVEGTEEEDLDIFYAKDRDPYSPPGTVLEWMIPGSTRQGEEDAAEALNEQDMVGEGPGDAWSQAPTKQEQSQGYKKTDVMTLQINVGNLRAKLEGIMGMLDPTTDAGVQAELKDLLAKTKGLEAQVTALYQGKASYPYPLLLTTYKAYEAQLAKYPVEYVTDEPAKAPPPKPPSSPKAPPPPTPVATPSPGAAIVQAPRKPLSTTTWGAIGAAGAVLVSKLAGLW